MMAPWPNQAESIALFHACPTLLGVEGANPRAAFSTKSPAKCQAFSFQLPEDLGCWKEVFGKRVELPEYS